MILAQPAEQNSSSLPEVYPLEQAYNYVAQLLLQVVRTDNQDTPTFQALHDILLLPDKPLQCDITFPCPKFVTRGDRVDVKAQEWATAALALHTQILGHPTLPNSDNCLTITDIKAQGIFIHFSLDQNLLRDKVLQRILTPETPSTQAYGFNLEAGRAAGGKPIILEFSSPNIGKPFHFGHLRSTIIGNFVRNVLARNGFKTFAINYLGDWGMQYGLLALGFKLYGSEEALLADPVRHLYQVYVKINQANKAEQEQRKAAWKLAQLEPCGNESTAETTAQDLPVVTIGSSSEANTLAVKPESRKKQTKTNTKPKCVENADDADEMQDDGEEDAYANEYAGYVDEDPESILNRAKRIFLRMENGDEEVLSLWRHFRDISIVKYEQVYKRLGIHFDLYSGESQVSDGIPGALKTLNDRHLLVTDPKTHCRFVDLEAENLGRVKVQKEDGTSLYITRDISAAVERHDKFDFSHMYYVVGVAQECHFQRLFRVLDLMGHSWAKPKCTHIGFGLVKGMSTRSGTAKFLEDILDHVKEAVLETMKASVKTKADQIEDLDGTADVVAKAALFVQDMSGRRHNDYAFDINRMTSFEGNTGPYLLYQYARLCSIDRKYVEAVANGSYGDLSAADITPCDYSLLTEPAVKIISKQLARYPCVVRNILVTFEPSALLTYLSAGFLLLPGQSLVSPNRMYRCSIGITGALELWNLNNLIWSSVGSNCNTANSHANGSPNLALKSPHCDLVYLNTLQLQMDEGPYRLIITDTGVVKIINNTNDSIWDYTQPFAAYQVTEEIFWSDRIIAVFVGASMTELLLMFALGREIVHAVQGSDQADKILVAMSIMAGMCAAVEVAVLFIEFLLPDLRNFEPIATYANVLGLMLYSLTIIRRFQIFLALVRWRQIVLEAFRGVTITLAAVVVVLYTLSSRTGLPDFIPYNDELQITFIAAQAAWFVFLDTLLTSKMLLVALKVTAAVVPREFKKGMRVVRHTRTLIYVSFVALTASDVTGLCIYVYGRSQYDNVWVSFASNVLGIHYALSFIILRFFVNSIRENPKFANFGTQTQMTSRRSVKAQEVPDKKLTNSNTVGAASPLSDVSLNPGRQVVNGTIAGQADTPNVSTSL